LTLDDDVADGLARVARRARRPYREVVNEVIRRGLRQPTEEPPFHVSATKMQRTADRGAPKGG